MHWALLPYHTPVATDTTATTSHPPASAADDMRIAAQLVGAVGKIITFWKHYYHPEERDWNTLSQAAEWFRARFREDRALVSSKDTDIK